MTCSNCAAYTSALSIAVVFYIGAQHLNSSLVQKNSVQNLRDLLLYQLTVLKRLRLGNNNHRRADQTAVQGVALLETIDHRVGFHIGIGYH